MRRFWLFLLVLPAGFVPTFVWGERNPFSRPAQESHLERLPATSSAPPIHPAAVIERPGFERPGFERPEIERPEIERPKIESRLPEAEKMLPAEIEVPAAAIDATLRSALAEVSAGLLARQPHEGNQEEMKGAAAALVLKTPAAPPQPSLTAATPLLIHDQPLASSEPETLFAVSEAYDTAEAYDTFEAQDTAPPVGPPLTPSRSPLFGPSIYGEDRIARVTGERLHLPSLIAPTTSPSEIGSKKLPSDIGGDRLALQELLKEGPERNADWAMTASFWQAPNTYSHPLYFEDVMLERHGHQRYVWAQPLVSGARFIATVPMLPYLMTVNHPCDHDYHLGHFRPGSCAPGLLQRPPYVRRAAIVQAAATAGAFLILP